MNDIFISRMSERLITVASMLGESRDMSFESKELSDAGSSFDRNIKSGVLRKFKRTADVGCDHGYISMYLVSRGISEKAIAMDVRKGPLSAAESNIREAGLSDKICIRLSDGLSELKEAEADSLVIAGMGGKLMISILEKGDPGALFIKMGVLQPQSDIEVFRQYLSDKGYVIVDERIVFEDGKYYFPMLVDFEGKSESRGAFDRACGELKVLLEKGCDVACQEDMADRDKMSPGFADGLREAGKMSSGFTDGLKAAEDRTLRIMNRYGVFNILRRDELLVKYLEHGRKVSGSILRDLDQQAHPERYRAVQQELGDIDILLKVLN